MDTINQCEIQSLIEYFSKTMYRAKYADDIAKDVMGKCIELAKLDYNVTILDNSSGDLCAHYPSHLIFMESENNPTGELIKNTIYEGIEPQRLRELISKSRSARCRTRFPMPVIFYQGKYVCRSATLSGGPEIYGRSGFDYFFAGDQSENNDDEDIEQPNNCNNWVLCDQVRKEDIKLLRALNVGTIVDFMVEKKKVKFGLNVTSSEKVDKENRYSQFTILSLPYPGCEFFREFRDQNYSAENLYYNWSQTHVDAEIIVPQDNITERVQVKWKDYKAVDTREDCFPTEIGNQLDKLVAYVPTNVVKWDSAHGATAMRPVEDQSAIRR
ncbi:myotubularin-related protein 14 [Macrosteles quadrilineatus]|uniref:myotubularin-related protein 14 n=1 Tax=Macrosteles quadrilineatus TaxID=74068 RepID=UPI0023E1D6FC|nr:myotubularin-related protein 14 [Macrosteles quadrilineatus]